MAAFYSASFDSSYSILLYSLYANYTFSNKSKQQFSRNIVHLNSKLFNALCIQLNEHVLIRISFCSCTVLNNNLLRDRGRTYGEFNVLEHT
jgi:hypothetical protein